jgi:hypothetical protein
VATAILAFCLGQPEVGTIWLVGSMIVGVIRRIEKERRAMEAAE